MKRKFTEEQCANLSEAMKKVHASGNHPGWKHINEQKDRLSYPERFLKEVLSNNGILSKFTVVPHLSVGRYFLDFAILELKLDIEVDGCQHFRTIEAIQHDKERDSYLSKEGWTVYRISWQEMTDNTKSEINELISFINNFESGLDRYYEVVLKPKQIRLPSGQKVKQEAEARWEPFKEIILNSGIDFSKFGWVNKVSKILNISSSKVCNWMRRYLPDFYESQCFKRK